MQVGVPAISRHPAGTLWRSLVGIVAGSTRSPLQKPEPSSGSSGCTDCLICNNGKRGIAMGKRCGVLGASEFLLAAILGLGTGNCPVKADSAEPALAPIVLDVGERGPVISPLLFGFNFEYTRYAMWKGLDAQLLANRSFAAKSEEKSAWRQGGVRNGIAQGLAAHWYGIGKPPVSFVLDTAEVYTGKQSQRIRVPAAGSKRRDRSARHCRSGRHGVRGPAAIESGFRGDGGRPPLRRFGANRVRPPVASTAKRRLADVRLSIGRPRKRTSMPGWKSSSRDRHRFGSVRRRSCPATTFTACAATSIARLKEIGVPLLRWPGGAFTRDYRWKEGLAPLDKRPPIHCPFLPFSDQYDFHEVGIDEYIALCRELGCQPCITVTMGIPEGAQEAADWVEYCNGSTETRWGKVRAQRGHKEPYGVR